MEDALVQQTSTVCRYNSHIVLILVLMEDALVPVVVPSQYGASVQFVLILVLMEDALVPPP